MRKVYKIIRGILFSLVLTVAAFYVLLYAALSLPFVQNCVKAVACSELNKLTGGTFEVERLSISPFNKVELQGVSLRDPQGEPVATAEKIGAGIGIWRLIFDGKVVVTFGEIVGLEAHIVQKTKAGPTNIQFLIDAFAPKDKNKPPQRFDLQIHNIVLRRCAVRFDRLWCPRLADPGRLDVNHLDIRDLAADLRLPVLRNDDFAIDLRRLSLSERSGLDVRSLGGKFIINADSLAIESLHLRLPGSYIAPSDVVFKLAGLKDIPSQILAQNIHISLSETKITPADFAPLLPVLANYPGKMTLAADVDYDRSNIAVNLLDISMPEGLELHLRGKVDHTASAQGNMRCDLSELSLHADGSTLSAILTDFLTLSQSDAAIIRRLGKFAITGKASGSPEAAVAKLWIECAQGTAKIDATARKVGKAYDIKGNFMTPRFRVGKLIDNSLLGDVSATTSLSMRVGPGILDGEIDLNAPLLQLKGYDYKNITARVSKRANLVAGNVSILDSNVDLDIVGEADIASVIPHADIQGNVRTLRLSSLGLAADYADVRVSGAFDISIAGNNLDNLNGYADFSDIRFSNNRYHDVYLDHVHLDSDHSELPYSLNLTSDIVDASVVGDFNFASLPASIKELASYFLPTLVGHVAPTRPQNYQWNVKVFHTSPLLDMLKLPVTLLEDLEISGACNTAAGTASILMDVPYLQQGRDKLIRNTHLALDVDTASNNCTLRVSSLLPNKKGDIGVCVEANAANDRINTDLAWKFDRPNAYHGSLSLTGTFGDKGPDGRPVIVRVNPSQFAVNDTIWRVAPALMRWSGQELSIDSVCVMRSGQLALIDGLVSKDADKELLVTLQNIDLDYVFETLNINYVTFGGRASGLLRGAGLLGPHPLLYTDALRVAGLTYNHSLLGDALIKSHFDKDRKAVHIDADVSEKYHRAARIYGDIFVGADSLSLEIDADKVNVGFLQPFMAAFSSDVQGRASGYVKLYGTFKDIDLRGRVFADTLRMKIDVTNTYYSARDSVIIDPGSIDLHNITLRDRQGHTALLNGSLRHRYFHDPTFDFHITGARNFLVYDTDATMNPRWWGTIYGNGSGTLHGVPGYISVAVDMTSAPGSSFTFVLDDHEEAADYEFITFTDKRKEAEELRIKEQMQTAEPEPEFLRRFRRQAEIAEQAVPTRYDMDLRMLATPDAKVTIVMDPVAGDRIAATGGGAMRMTYNSDDELNLYGTYTLAQGLYNFTLQDLIVRDFKIREGSKITFNGDPLRAILSLTAAYRVNTSLTELDKSFATDRELNRTNVPVEALLKVDGEMQSPEISFDLDFPTLSSDVAGKVRSIVSTSDMMNRQIIYLLALNRFYTPDYMNTDGSNNELASVASSTLSTQLGQMLGQLAPGWTFSPYFRTEKGDFSDMEVDLALSSALFNNRLLFNGNVGYRDRTTSNTTFVGDFDLEYLLNPSGTLRLKAYNHFNDQNYYLRSALTTQGIGILYKRDFNRFLPGLFRRRKPAAKTPAAKTPASSKSDSSIRK